MKDTASKLQRVAAHSLSGATMMGSLRLRLFLSVLSVLVAA